MEQQMDIIKRAIELMIKKLIELLRKPGEVLKNPEPGEVWQFVNRDESPWPKEKPDNHGLVEILDCQDGWVRYRINRAFPDERCKVSIFKYMYRP